MTNDIYKEIKYKMLNLYPESSKILAYHEIFDKCIRTFFDFETPSLPISSKQYDKLNELYIKNGSQITKDIYLIIKNEYLNIIPEVKMEILEYILNKHPIFIPSPLSSNDVDEVLNKIGELNYNEDIENQLRLCILDFLKN